MFEVYQSMNSYLTLQIKKLEAQIRVVMDSDSSLKKTYGLLTSMKGIGPVIAANMITSTHNFTRFANWRKFSCYIGTANERLVPAPDAINLKLDSKQLHKCKSL